MRRLAIAIDPDRRNDAPACVDLDEAEQVPLGRQARLFFCDRNDVLAVHPEVFRAAHHAGHISDRVASFDDAVDELGVQFLLVINDFNRHVRTPSVEGHVLKVPRAGEQGSYPQRFLCYSMILYKSLCG